MRVVVIGAGAAGLVAAAEAANRNASVLLLEKNNKTGVKILMSGASLFGQKSVAMSTPQIEWKFSKGGYEEKHAVEDDGYSQFSHILSEDPSISPEFDVLGVVEGNPRLDIWRSQIVTEDSIFILERKSLMKNKQDKPS